MYAKYQARRRKGWWESSFCQGIGKGQIKLNCTGEVEKG